MLIMSVSILAMLCWNCIESKERGITTRTPPRLTRNRAYLVKARHGAVASENKRCSVMGVDVLKNGGNAVDAAISTALCIGVVNMFSSGIGGGGFMTVRLPPHTGSKSEAWTVDFREVAPQMANSTMFVADPQSAVLGGLAIGIPGELRGFEEAHRRWGRLPWKRLVEPSIRLAEGWEVDRELGKRIPLFVDLMLNNSDWSAIFAPNGILLKEGQIIKRTNLSQTLATIAEEGADAFYKGPIANSIIRKVQSAGGIISHSDLERYNVKVEQALEGTYNGQRIMTTHAPTSGPVLLHMLNLLENFNFTVHDGLNTHRMVEAMKFGFAARTKICDPKFDMSDNISKIAAKEYAAKVVVNMTDDTTHTPDYYKPEYDIIHDHGTSHTSVLDCDGMAVSLTSTINLVFGSHVLDPGTGIILNNEMDDFSIPGTPNAFGLWPSPYNYPEPGKRPLSSTAPTVVESKDGSLHLVIGGSGGSRIFGSIFQVMLNLDWGLDVSNAIEYGRLHDQLYPQILEADNIYPMDLLNDLRVKGHNVTVVDVDRIAAVIQAIVQQNGTIYAASDSRKNGVAAGY
ncbi:hypothetical protein AX17_005599 [Amanita inopinata Kibby_2008]|nr:hypothetical protein AX17_005599 [Amanita inopinata Kibby_2008]